MFEQRRNKIVQVEMPDDWGGPIFVRPLSRDNFKKLYKKYKATDTEESIDSTEEMLALCLVNEDGTSIEPSEYLTLPIGDVKLLEDKVLEASGLGSDAAKKN